MSYQVKIKQNYFTKLITDIKPAVIICDSNVDIKRHQNVLKITTSEINKNFDMYFEIIDYLLQKDVNRTDTIIIVGGGVLIDVASFACSTFKRGINYINVPTTTLAMIDSSIGSKNGLNYQNYKNIIGMISDPQMVLIDIDFLTTLNKRHFNNGLAEAIKIGYLSNEKIINHLNSEELDIEYLISLCVDEKMKYVKRDKEDFGYRNFLNFGHTFAHSIETVTNFKKYLHGEAVSIGMVIASNYDKKLIELLEKYELPTKLPLDINVDKLIELMKADKKNSSHLTKIIKAKPNQIAELTASEIKQMITRKIIIRKQFDCQTITVNRSKSHIHRALALALSLKTSVSFDFNPRDDLSEDVIQSLNILKQSNCQINYLEHELHVDCRFADKSEEQYFIKKSATTYRLFAPILCSLFTQVDIELDEQLNSRPHFVFANEVQANTHMIDVSLDNYTISGAISSQFISGYIIAAINKTTPTIINIVDNVTSLPYIDMTIKVANNFGANVKREERKITITPTVVKEDIKLQIENDYSSLAFFVIYNKLCQIHNINNKISIPQKRHVSMQADSIIYDILDEEVIDVTNCPDLTPILIMYGLLNKRGIVLTNISRIKYKECDRITAMIENINCDDCFIRASDKLIVKPTILTNPIDVRSFGDHRIAMAFAVCSPFIKGQVVIDDYTVSHKSFPTFFSQLLGANYECIK